MSSAAPEATPAKGLKALAPFPRPFWVINGVEFLERGAYYGVLSVLSVFLTNDLGLSSAVTGILLAIQFPLLYFLPMVAGALAEKFGFRALLVFSFASLLGGYAAIATATGAGGILLGIILFGFGAGAFKPMPAATVAQTTSESTRNFGFSLYYWFINAGAFSVPLLLALVFGGDYRTYFWAAAVVSVANLAASVFIWRNVVPADRTIKVTGALRRMSELARFPALIVLFVIYSGFWFMYSMTTSYLQTYVDDFALLSRSMIALIIPLNAFAIIALGPVLGKLTEKAPSLPLMIAGITVYVSGFTLLAFVQATWAVLAAVVIYSAGEFLTHPGFLSYVSKVSPAERVAIFMGYGFLPVGIGQTLGTLVGGFLYDPIAIERGQPQLFWAIMSSVGLATIAALLVYNHVLQRRKAAREAPAPVAPVATARRRGFLTGPGLAAVAVLAVPALLAAGMASPASDDVVAAGSDVEALDSTDLVTIRLDPVDGETREGETTTQTLTLPELATGEAVFTLTWSDEDAGPGATNAPDTFRVRVTAPDGTVAEHEDANRQGQEGRIDVSLNGIEPGDYVVEIELVNAGDSTVVGVLPVGRTADDGNAWTLTASYHQPNVSHA